MKKYFIIPLLACTQLSIAQYAPPAGQAGTTAMHQDSSAFVGWATGCSVQRGLQKITDPSSGYASVGDSTSPLGKPGSSTISLGDSGVATLTFARPITDKPGWDFAVFENSFSDDFLELAFVEVSSDGQNFYRFPAHSLTQDTSQVASFGTTDATRINNLAGKYRVQFGTPFDLSELQNIAGLDLQKITHVRVVDVIGTIQEPYASRDTAGNKVNDPWPTAFPSSGYDLTGVGVIHQFQGTALTERKLTSGLYPNPAQHQIHLPNIRGKAQVRIFDLSGSLVLSQNLAGQQTLHLQKLPAGTYLLEVNDGERNATEKLIIE